MAPEDSATTLPASSLLTTPGARRPTLPSLIAELAERDATERAFLLRRRVQKLRWLGLEEEAERLAADLRRPRDTRP